MSTCSMFPIGTPSARMLSPSFTHASFLMANINYNNSDGRDDSVLHARRHPLLPAPTATINDGTVNNYYDTMMVNPKSRGIIPSFDLPKMVASGYTR